MKFIINRVRKFFKNIEDDLYIIFRSRKWEIYSHKSKAELVLSLELLYSTDNTFKGNISEDRFVLHRTGITSLWKGMRPTFFGNISSVDEKSKIDGVFSLSRWDHFFTKYYFMLIFSSIPIVIILLISSIIRNDISVLFAIGFIFMCLFSMLLFLILNIKLTLRNMSFHSKDIDKIIVELESVAR